MHISGISLNLGKSPKFTPCAFVLYSMRIKEHDSIRWTVILSFHFSYSFHSISSRSGDRMTAMSPLQWNSWYCVGFIIFYFTFVTCEMNILLEVVSALFLLLSVNWDSLGFSCVVDYYICPIQKLLRQYYTQTLVSTKS